MVKGHINITCDAWQASNVDGYFTVTGSWVEENQPGTWKVQTTLLGFVHLNNAYNGTRLSQTLYKVVKRVGITHKVGPLVSVRGLVHDGLADWLYYKRQCNK